MSKKKESQYMRVPRTALDPATGINHKLVVATDSFARQFDKNATDLVHVKAVAASAYQVLNLALNEPKDSAMTAHLVHCATVALGTIED